MGVGYLPGVMLQVRAGRGFPSSRKATHALIERSEASYVKVMMSRANFILVSVIPALVLLVSLDCFTDSFSSCPWCTPSCVAPADGHNNQNRAPADSSFDQAVHRWSRRLNDQPGSNGFSPPVALALWQPAADDRAVHWTELPLRSLPLAQFWQFYWRAASEPRAPSLVS